MPNFTHFNLTAGNEVTISVKSTAFEPQLVLLEPNGSVYDTVCGELFPLTADTTVYTADTDLLTADAARSATESIAALTFVVPVTGLWAAQIGSCDGGCGGYIFAVHCF